MHETVNLSDPACPLQIEYSKPAMEQIRRRARAGLMAAPRVGMAVGGLLLGVKEDSRVRILDSVELPCSHSTGPSFTLTPEEKRECMDIVAEANTLSAASRVTVVGWYCSKTRGDAALSDSDRSLFKELFPGAGQIALVLRPDVFEMMRAAFFYRADDGIVRKGIECEVDEWRPLLPEPSEPQTPEPEALATARSEIEAKPAPAPPPEPAKVIEIRQPELKTPPPVQPVAETSLKDIIGLSSVEPESRQPVSPAYLRPELGPPAFVAKPKPSVDPRLLWLAAAVVMIVGLLVFFTRDSWYPRPPLNLTFSELDGSVLIHWDPASLQGLKNASMYINDGSQVTPSVIPLDRLQMASGQLSYTPRSKHITAKLDAGIVSAYNTWVQQEKTPAPADPPPPAAAPSH